MKFYIAARFDEREMVRALQHRLRAAGHEITADWTSHDALARYGDMPDKARAYAVEDLQGVGNADVFVFITGPTVGTGSHTELGAAIAGKLATAKPRVFVVGEHNTRSIMYFHPAVERLESVEAALAAVGVTL